MSSRLPLPFRINPSYSSTGVKHKSVLSATPQQKLTYNFSTLSCNSKFAIASERKHLPDTRPLADASYHQSCINQILDFCSKNNYIIRKESLNFMSLNEMEKLFAFILSFYEIKIKQNCLDIEIPKVMESLCYPYNINKTSLRSYATPKSKGVVLSMLVFLIEPLVLERNSIFSNSEDDPNLENLKLILNRNQDEKNNFINQRMNEQLMKKNELEAFIKKTEELKNESLSLDNQEDQLKKLRENVEYYENQLEEFKGYEENMRNYVESSSKENDEIRKKIELTDQEIKSLNERKLELESKIKEQAHSIDEMNYYMQREKQVQIEITKLSEELKKVRQEYFQEKLKQDELFDNMKELFFKLTTVIHTFKDDLTDAQNLKECLENEQFKTLIEFINDPDFENGTKFSLDSYAEFLRSIKQALNNDLHFCKDEICKCQSELELILDRIKKLELKNELIVEEKQKLIRNVELEILKLTNEIKNKKVEVEKVKAEISAIDADFKLKRKIAMNENLARMKECEETKKEFNDYWLSIKTKVNTLENHLKTVLPINKVFEEEKERARRLNQKLNDHLNDAECTIEKLMNDIIIK